MDCRCDNQPKKQYFIAKYRQSLYAKKIVIEKIHKIQTEARNKQQQNIVLALNKILKVEDTIATDLQTMIFNLLKEAYTQALKAQYDPTIPALLKNFEPDFIRYPYYDDLVKNLDTYARPVDSITAGSETYTL